MDITALEAVVHTAPFNVAPMLARVHAGDSLTGDADAPGWLRVQLPDGQRGFLSVADAQLGAHLPAAAQPAVVSAKLAPPPASGTIVSEKAPDPAPRGSSLSIEGGNSTTAVVIEADLHTGFGFVVGVMGGTVRGPAVGGHIAYRVPLSSRWSLEPGIRAMTIWESAENCGPRCQFNFFTIDLGIRYQGPAGFVFKAGLPVVAWIPVGQDQYLESYFLSAEAIAATASLLFGYAFNL